MRYNDILNIRNYVSDGFVKVCDVTLQYNDWIYKNINEEIMYAQHCSWVYFIVENSRIVKCGETSKPLGIREKQFRYKIEVQPVSNSTCRFGRLRKGDGTDAFIRNSLRYDLLNGHEVSLWAKKCPIYCLKESINGVIKTVHTTIHKNLEIMYLDYFKSKAFCLPALNKTTK